MLLEKFLIKKGGNMSIKWLLVITYLFSYAAAIIAWIMFFFILVLVFVKIKVEYNVSYKEEVIFYYNQLPDSWNFLVKFVFLFAWIETVIMIVAKCLLS